MLAAPFILVISHKALQRAYCLPNKFCNRFGRLLRGVIVFAQQHFAASHRTSISGRLHGKLRLEKARLMLFTARTHTSFHFSYYCIALVNIAVLICKNLTNLAPKRKWTLIYRNLYQSPSLFTPVAWEGIPWTVGLVPSICLFFHLSRSKKSKDGNAENNIESIKRAWVFIMFQKLHYRVENTKKMFYSRGF